MSLLNRGQLGLWVGSVLRPSLTKTLEVALDHDRQFVSFTRRRPQALAEDPLVVMLLTIRWVILLNGEGRVVVLLETTRGLAVVFVLLPVGVSGILLKRQVDFVVVGVQRGH